MICVAMKMIFSLVEFREVPEAVLQSRKLVRLQDVSRMNTSAQEPALTRPAVLYLAGGLEESLAVPSQSALSIILPFAFWEEVSKDVLVWLSLWSWPCWQG